MVRQFFPITFRWRDASGRTAHTRLYWAGTIERLFSRGLPRILAAGGDLDAPPFSRPLEWCSNAALEAIDGPVPVGFFGLDGGPRYGVGGHAYGTCEDFIELVWHSQFVDAQGPPASWSFRIPAPRVQGSTPEEEALWGSPFTGVLNPFQGRADEDYPAVLLNVFLGYFLADVTGNGPPYRWNSPINEDESGWCSDTGVYLTNFSCLPRLGHRPPGVLTPLGRQADLTRPAL